MFSQGTIVSTYLIFPLITNNYLYYRMFLSSSFMSFIDNKNDQNSLKSMAVLVLRA